MILERKFIESITTEKDDVKLIQQCVSIADDFAIGFAIYLNGYVPTAEYLQFIAGKPIEIESSTKFLLTEYKKQNNL